MRACNMTPLFAADDAPTRQLSLSRRLQLYYTFPFSTTSTLVSYGIPVRHLLLVRATAHNPAHYPQTEHRILAQQHCWQACFRRLSNIHRTTTWPRHSKVIVDHLSCWTSIVLLHVSSSIYPFFNQYFVFSLVLGAISTMGK